MPKELNIVEVIFENPQYNYITNVSSHATKKSCEDYFVGKSFNVAAHPKENMQLCIAIKFEDKNKMVTQINHLRSGKKHQLLNNEIDYSMLEPCTSHVGHKGSDRDEVKNVWDTIIFENPKHMLIKIKEIKVLLTANWSLSNKSVSYHGCLPITKEDLKEKFNLTPTKKKNPYITISSANMIIVGNGKNSYTYVCPSLITIL